MPKKCIALIGLNNFFFASIAESRATFLKLVLDRVSKFGWMKNWLQFCVLKIKAVLSFFKSLNLSPLNSKSLENSYSITCRVRRKVIRKGVCNVTKMANFVSQNTRNMWRKNLSVSADAQC